MEDANNSFDGARKAFEGAMENTQGIINKYNELIAKPPLTKAPLGITEKDWKKMDQNQYRRVQQFENTLSTIGLAVDSIRGNVPAGEANTLIKLMREGLDAAVKIIDPKNDKEIEELQNNIAKIEGTLKGFKIPDLEKGLTAEQQKEHEAATKAVAQALRETAGQNVPATEFAKEIQNRAQTILAGEGKEYNQTLKDVVARGASIEAKVEKFQTISKEHLTEAQRTEVDRWQKEYPVAVRHNVTELSNFLHKDTIKMEEIAPKVEPSKGNFLSNLFQKFKQLFQGQPKPSADPSKEPLNAKNQTVQNLQASVNQVDLPEKQSVKASSKKNSEREKPRLSYVQEHASDKDKGPGQHKR